MRCVLFRSTLKSVADACLEGAEANAGDKGEFVEVEEGQAAAE